MAGPPDRIVAAARRRFRQFGYAKTSMQDIAGACRMSAANLYRFYPGKLAIAAAVALGDLQEQLSICDDATRVAGGETTDRLIAFFRTNIRESRRRRKQAPLLFELGLKVAREDPDVRRRFLDAVESRITAMLAGSRKLSPAEARALEARGRLILVASAPFVLPWMVLNEPFGDPRAHVEPLVRALVPDCPGVVRRGRRGVHPVSPRNIALFGTN